MAATMVDLGGYKLAAEISGAGSPTVVFISCIGDAGEVWDEDITALRCSTTAEAIDDLIESARRA